ncbi:glycoside hydrolase family 13 protein [Yinghuangia soli]|uniref:Glycoside hydrolase family 13 protein n=1 Tax=Yinghuangia soli TaxID=2908204 RepID=A0AA41Q5J9_9ACTN|nr:glycoside hydrolase family 13 protein [Yinghuangia soli]MCF2531701.1 glycoside hydrolase family 13 protein [Yinghuangia soli]
MATHVDGGEWWRDAVFYQVYPRSFADADGDGVGDLPGVVERLPHLRDLGVDALWLSPFYPSPMADAGYDVADPRGVDPLFGTLADFDLLVDRAHALGLRVVVDVVPNHTSHEHAWFRAALAAAPGSPERARYLFRDGRGPGGDAPPNDWTSQFGGAAWTRTADADGRPGQWYLHLYAPEQPDLNWRNLEVRAEYLSILRHWLDRGVDGFRIDVAHGLVKAVGLPDAGEIPQGWEGRMNHRLPYWDQPEVHDIYRGWRQVLDAYPGDRIAVAEAWVPQPERLAAYTRPDELHQAFNFPYLMAGWDAERIRSVVDSSLAAADKTGAPPTWVLANHDVVRAPTRLGGLDRALAALLVELALPGSVYLYQGEELGLEEVLDLPDELRQDPVFLRSGGKVRGRDGCRVPLPWSDDGPALGFSPSGRSWLPQPAAWRALNAASQAADPASTLQFYRRALRLRREHPALGRGTGPAERAGRLTWMRTPPGTLAFVRDPGFVCTANPTDAPVEYGPIGALLLASGPVDASPDGGHVLPAHTTAWWSVGG